MSVLGHLVAAETAGAGRQHQPDMGSEDGRMLSTSSDQVKLSQWVGVYEQGPRTNLIP